MWGTLGMRLGRADAPARAPKGPDGGIMTGLDQAEFFDCVTLFDELVQRGLDAGLGELVVADALGNLPVALAVGQDRVTEDEALGHAVLTIR